MLDLDFAFFNLINKDKQGLFYQKGFLDRLTPIFFSPRVKNLIELPDINCQGCNIVLPLGQGNIQVLEQAKQKMMFQRSYSVARNFQLQAMAVDRRLKEFFLEPEEGFSLVFGDNFIKALAYAIIKQSLSSRDINKLILVGDIPGLSEFVEAVSNLNVPVSIQNPYPSRYEIMTYRLMYEKGNAISNSQINPYKWEKGNLVIIFDSQYNNLSIGIPDVMLLKLTNESQGLASALELGLRSNEVTPLLCNLAPIMETCLLAQEGFSVRGREQNMLIKEDILSFQQLEELGNKAGIWHLFLDKVA